MLLINRVGSFVKIENINNPKDVCSVMVMRTIEMREIGFPISKNKRKAIKDRIRSLYHDEFEFFEDGDMLCVKGDFHNRFKRRKILFMMSGGKIGEDNNQIR